MIFSTGLKIGDLERPGKRRRRNSDSEMYCKAPEGQTRKKEKREQFLADEKFAFVQRYLETVHETHSITTETSDSDSGVKTHGAPSELEMEDISGNHIFYCILYKRTHNTYDASISTKKGKT